MAAPSPTPVLDRVPAPTLTPTHIATSTLPLPAPLTPAPVQGPPASPREDTRSPSGSPLQRRPIPGALPAPSGDPLHLDLAHDPVLAFARAETAAVAFRAAIAAAVARNPALDEAAAQADEARGVLGEAKARQFPVADLSLSNFQVISRAFSNDPLNLLERSRPRHRTDGLAHVQQPVIDFGASIGRIRASRARLAAATAGVEDTGTQVALRAVSAWYAVYGYRVLVRLGDAFLAGQRDLHADIDARIRQGAAAPGDAAQVDSYIASAASQLADLRRQLAGAEAQYAATIGAPAPAGLSRAPTPALDGIAGATMADDTEKLPAVRAARLGLEAARQDVRAVQADRLPQLGAALDAGRYGIVETARDYDLRGTVTLSMRLGGGGGSRVDQAEARAAGADARLRRVRLEARRDADIALADVAALEAAEAALEENYVASRRSRDVLAERFRVSRGTLFDVLGAESNYFGVAARYVQAVIELDTARYALLARTGRLLPALGINPATLDPR